MKRRPPILPARSRSNGYTGQGARPGAVWSGLQSPLTLLSPGPHLHQAHRPQTITASFHSNAASACKARKSAADGLPHLTARSEVHQISVGHKACSRREAVAVGLVLFSNPELLGMIQNHAVEKGDVLAVARVAGIMAVKQTSSLIPLAHNSVAVEGCRVDVSFVSAQEEDGEGRGKDAKGVHGGLAITVVCESTGKTGVEMEALCGVVGAALTVVDMCKGVDKGVRIENVKVAGKKGGKSGSWGLFAGTGKSGSQRTDESSHTDAGLYAGLPIAGHGSIGREESDGSSGSDDMFRSTDISGSCDVARPDKVT